MTRNVDKPGAMTLREVADRLQVPERTVLCLLGTGRLRGDRNRAGWRVAERDLRAFLQASANMDVAAERRRPGPDSRRTPATKDRPSPRLVLVQDDARTIAPMPGHGLDHIDLRVIEFACRFLGWDLETAETPEGETFAVLGSPAFEDVVYILTRQAQAYVLSEFPARLDGPRVYAKGSLQAVFEVLPETRRYHRSA